MLFRSVRKIEVRQAGLTVEETRKIFANITRNIYYGLRSLEEGYQVTGERVKAMEEALRNKQLMYQQGMITLADLSKSEQELAQAKYDLFEMAYRHVHIYGLPVDMEPLMEAARKYHLAVIEDAAEAIGQTAYGKPCGSFGDISCFSFYPNKHVTTDERRMVLCNDDALAARCRALRNLCFVPERRFVHHELGYNFRMSNISLDRKSVV